MTKELNYQELTEELTTILSSLQSEDISVDDALKQYERGMAITKQLETYLQKAENTVKIIREKS